MKEWGWRCRSFWGREGTVKGGGKRGEEEGEREK